ncbi:4Fe-4S binding domain-containing protein [Cohaesibacter marisflavi]|uniref:4Fe-4S binding domain-containing protein n=1 Tax=Cohaesibacter marisflavi TaxID=655353 RepID=A0A1I5LUE7_9HYPH|nr:4Fe-4S dicluster domain-containing protein [Cohaesibacter marisflavi]SFP00958.1 4Fe-4S binding domain-containing protein [Cohaesibacter marisflavi]
MNFLQLFAHNLTKGPFTDPFPFEPAPTAKRFRGKIEFDPETCEGCRKCEKVCPAGAIRFTKTANGLEFDCWHDSCVFCGNCEFHCPTNAIHQTQDWHLAHVQQDKFSMVEHGVIPSHECPSCGKPALYTAAPANKIKGFSEAEVAEFRSLCPKCRGKYLRERKSRS